MKKVTLLQNRLFHYKVELFEQLREKLKSLDIELNLVHGQASMAEKVRKDEGEIAWAHVVKNKYWTVYGKDLCWQPFPESLKDSDLIILMQENRILSNYVFLFKSFVSQQKIAYWGHGANLQSLAPRGLREQWKKFWLLHVNWWFAYTQYTVNILTNAGYSKKRITCLNNAIDNKKFISDLNNVTSEKLKEILDELNINDSHKVGVFCGSLYTEKKLDLLVQAAELIHEQVPEFILIVIGDGPSAPQLREQLGSHSWAHCVGVKKGIEKAAFFRLSEVILNPGAVGLHVLDAFCAALPMITTKNSLHGPEVVYLEHGINGFLTSDDPNDYANTVIKLLIDSSEWERISSNAKSSSIKYTLENMVKNYADGILRALE